MGEHAFIEDEKIERREGALALNWRLFKSLPLFWWCFPLSLVTIVLSSVAPSFYRWYSGRLLEGSGPASVWGFSDPISFSLRGLVLLTALALVFRIAAWAFFETSGMWSAQRLHARMVRAMMRTRTTFYDENPSGRLINRLIRDYDEARSIAIIFVGDLFNATVEVLSIGMVAAFASPWAVVMLLPLLIGFQAIQHYRSAMLDHARTFSAVATGRVLSRQTDLIDGREIFLLYGKAGKLLERMAISYGEYVKASAWATWIEVWASFWIRAIAEVFSLLVLIFLAFAVHEHRLDAALAGVVISSLVGITGSVGWLDFASGMIARSLPHVRRVFEYIDLPTEESEEGTPRPRVRSDEAETIVFDEYAMSYRANGPLVFDGLNLRLAIGRKTALIGRTGSGKTSLTQALFRMVHVRGGDIRMDGQSIFGVTPLELRRRFGVVPQAPYLFEGTVASNLDRTGTVPRAELAQALQTVGLAYALDHVVNEGGLNLSVGERQLLCLARVIAARKDFIVMDEPTSGLDPQTDARLTQVLRTAFQGKTLITIAHRRESLRHYDWVVELKHGRVVREGSPREMDIGLPASLL